YRFPLSHPAHPRHLHSFPTRRSSDLAARAEENCYARIAFERHIDIKAGIGAGRREMLLNGKLKLCQSPLRDRRFSHAVTTTSIRSEEHTSELQSLRHLVCRLLLEKKK